MFDMVFSSTKLFFQGKLFQDTALAIRLLVTGAAAATVATVLVGMVGMIYLFSALLLNGGFIYYAWKLKFSPEPNTDAPQKIEYKTRKGNTISTSKG